MAETMVAISRILDEAGRASSPAVVCAARSDDESGGPEPAASVDLANRFKRMVGQNYDFVWRSLRGLGVAAGAVDDAAQHVFVVASRKIASIAEGSERNFLFGTVLGVAANARRSQAARREVSDELALGTAVDAGRNPEEELERREQCRLLEAALDAMPNDLRVVFVLFELEGLSSTEIAAMLAIPAGTVASRLRRAREDFQARMAREHARRSTLARPGALP